MNIPRISVVLPTRNPRRACLAEVLAGLRAQTSSPEQWEFCLVDNGSSPPLRAESLAAGFPFQLVAESRPGLLWARLRGLHETRGDYVVFIDDDTVPDAGFLSAAVKFLDAHPGMGTAGGQIVPRFDQPPPAWIDHAAWCLALRDNGPTPLEWSAGDGPLPSWTPIGAGLLVRRAALVPGYEQHVEAHWRDIERISWQGQGVGGVEDKDLVLHCLRAGWSTGYAPDMRLTHLIPAARLDRGQMERLIRKLECLWMRTLHAHGFNPMAPIHPLTVLPRQAKSWLMMRAWRSPAERFHWVSSCGRLRGLAKNYSDAVRYPAPPRT